MSAEARKLRVVVKIGTSSIIHNVKDGAGGVATQLALVHLASTVSVLCELRRHGHDVVLVSSGAVGSGCHRCNLKERPSEIVTRQALASIGQVHLMGKYETLFSSMGSICAQVLLTYENFVDRVQFLNAKNTFDELFKLGAVPIVNENDTVGIQELKADNDKLAGMVSNMIGADLVFLMTDVNGVYTANPRQDPSARRIEFVTDFDALRKQCKLGDGKDSNWGTGGMAAKISAAALATSLGVRTVIMNADDVAMIPAYVRDEQDEMASGKIVRERFRLGTTFERSKDPPRERKRWIRSLHRRGSVTVDAGAARAVLQHKTLFVVGITAVTGEFNTYEAVAVLDPRGLEIAYGLSSFSSADLRKVKGMNSDMIFELTGQSAAAIERENLDVPDAGAHAAAATPPVPQPPPPDAALEASFSSKASSKSNPSFTPPEKRPDVAAKN